METIDIKDLVIGSLIQDESGQSWLVALFSSSGICDLEARSIGTSPTRRRLFDYAELRPIPITAEWLLKLGFIQHQNKFELLGANNEYTYQIATVHHVFSDSLPTHFLKLEDSDERHYTLPVSYVHQLQALLWQIERVWLTIQP